MLILLNNDNFHKSFIQLIVFYGLILSAILVIRLINAPDLSLEEPNVTPPKTQNLPIITSYMYQPYITVPAPPKDVIIEIKTTTPTMRNIPVISSGRNKTYMDIYKVTNKKSPQYKYIQDYIIVNPKGYAVTRDGYIGVALGSAFGSIGSKFLFELSSGKVIKLVKIEEKADRDTVKGFYTAHDKSVIEFVIDTYEMRDNTYRNGYIYGGNFNNNPEFEGEIKFIWSVE